MGYNYSGYVVRTVGGNLSVCDVVKESPLVCILLPICQSLISSVPAVARKQNWDEQKEVGAAMTSTHLLFKSGKIGGRPR